MIGTGFPSNDLLNALAKQSLGNSYEQLAYQAQAHDAALRRVRDLDVAKTLLSPPQMQLDLQKAIGLLSSPQTDSLAALMGQAESWQSAARALNSSAHQSIRAAQDAFDRNRKAIESMARLASSAMSQRVTDTLWPMQQLVESQLESAKSARRMIERINAQLGARLDSARIAYPAQNLEDLLDQWTEPDRVVTDHSAFYDLEPNADERTSPEELRQEAEQIERAVGAVPEYPWQGSRQAAKQWREMILFYIALLTFIQGLASDSYALYQAHSEARQSQAQEKIEAARHQAQLAVLHSIDGSIQRLQDHLVAASPECVVHGKGASVRSRPGEGYILGRVYPNQVVRVTGKAGRWAKVRYTDHVDGREVEGWLLKHYLKPFSGSREPSQLCPLSG